MRLQVCAALFALSTTVLAADKPQFGTWGFDAPGMDARTRPGDDFFRHVNGVWLDRTKIPPDKPAFSLRILMTVHTEQRLHDMMEEAAKKNETTGIEGKVGAFYKAFMDEARIESLGAKPIAPEVDLVRAAKTRDDLAAVMGKSTVDFENAIFNINTDIDLKNPKRYAVYLSQGGLGLPDRDYYLQPQFAAQKAAYQAYVAKILHLIDWPQAEARAKDVVDFETRLANASWTKAQDRDVQATYNPVAVADLQRLAPGFDWNGFLQSASLAAQKRVIVAEKSAFPNLAAVYAATPLETLKAWEAFHIADAAAPYLSRAFTAAWFEMHDKTLAGKQQE